MNNNEFMKYLTEISKNNNQKNLIFLLGTIAVISLVGCVILNSKYQRFRKAYGPLEVQNSIKAQQLLMQNDKSYNAESNMGPANSNIDIENDNNNPVLQ